MFYSIFKIITVGGGMVNRVKVVFFLSEVDDSSERVISSNPKDQRVSTTEPIYGARRVNIKVVHALLIGHII